MPKKRRWKPIVGEDDRLILPLLLCPSLLYWIQLMLCDVIAKSSRWMLVHVFTSIIVCSWCNLPASAVQPPSSDAISAHETDESKLERIAHDIITASPLADDADASARDAAGAKLAHCENLLGSCGETILWGGFDAEKGYDPDAYTLTQFAPMVWAKLYLSLFMFTGEHSIHTENNFQVLELTAKFRQNLDAGDFPYPLWHSITKWQAHLNVSSIMLIARGGHIVAAFRKADSNPQLPDRKWDGQWQWSTPDGAAQPRVSLFQYLFSTDNPHREALENTYRKLEAGFRGQGCISCHAPDNPSQASPLVLLLYPNQSLGARHEIVRQLKRNHMPPIDPTTGSDRGIADDAVRANLISLAEEFSRQGDEALAFERKIGQEQGAASRPADLSKWSIQSDDWYSLTLAGTRAGWMRVAREDDGNRYRTVTEVTLEFHQAGTDLNADSYVEWTESHDGEPLRFVIAKKNKPKLTNFDIGSSSIWEKTRDRDPQGLLIFKREWYFNAQQVTKIIFHDDQQTQIPDAMPNGPWLTPAAAQRFIGRRIADHARAIEYGSIDAPDSLRYVSVRSTLVGPGDFSFDGKLIPVTVWRTQTSVNPGQTISQFAQDGKLMFSSVDLGIGVLETRLCKKDEALSKPVAASAPQIAYPVVKPDQELKARSRATFELRLKDGKLPHLPSAGAQTAEPSQDENTVRVSVVTNRTSPATNPEKADAELHERSPVVGSDDPVVVDLAAQSLRETKGLSEQELAASSRAIVHRHFMDRELANPVGPLAVAGLQLRHNGAEQARALCAVLRVHRISSRLASGLVYRAPPEGDAVFEWREWTQALISERWVDLDPSGTEPFDAGHILTGFTSVGGANSDPDPAGFARLLSDLQIKIVSQE